MAVIAVNAAACVPATIRGPARESPWTVATGDLARAPSADEALSSDPSLFWTADAARATADAFAVGDSVIVIQGTSHKLTVIWRLDGARAWSSRVRGEGTTGPLLSGEMVFTATGGRDGHIYAYRMHTGRPEWDISFGFVEGSIALSDSLLFAVSGPGRVLAVDRATGAEVWRTSLHGRTAGGVTLIDGRLTMTTSDSIVALDPATGETLRTAPLPAEVMTPPAVSGGLLVFASPEGILFALDRNSFAESWRVALGEPSFGGAVIARDTAFATSISGKLWRVPLRDPGAVSHLDLGTPIRAAPAPIRNGVLVGTLSGELLLLTDSATPVWRIRVDGPIDVAPIVNRGVLFLVDGRGRLHTWH